MNTATCADRVRPNLEERIEDIRRLWSLYNENPEAYDEELGNLDEYGLCFDYVPPGTFRDQAEGYFRWQLSTGGPGDEFRFYADRSPNRFSGWSVYRIEYWFLDWFDGAHINLSGEDEELMRELFEFFAEVGTVDHEHDKAMEV